MSALALMAASENRWLTIGEGDTVILSSHPIPGNEMSVTKVIDGLVRLGVKVVHSGIEDVHATGHAKQEELKTLLSIVRARVVHAGARRVPPPGAPRRAGPDDGRARRAHVLLCEDGDQIIIDDKGIRKSGQVPAGYLYVDGIVGDVGHGVLRDRRVLAEEGVVVVVVTVGRRRRRHHHRARGHHPGLGVRPRGRGPARRVRRRRSARRSRTPSPTPTTPDIESLQRAVRRRRRPVRERPHQAPPDDRPRGHGGLGLTEIVLTRVGRWHAGRHA